jgi:hypothetical protein
VGVDAPVTVGMFFEYEPRKADRSAILDMW